MDGKPNLKNMEQETFLKHEDERRILYDVMWHCMPDIKSIKIIVAKLEIPIGNHYHKLKDEFFFLISGQIINMTIGSDLYKNIKAPFNLKVIKNTYHSITLETGSILLCGATEQFNADDDYT